MSRQLVRRSRSAHNVGGDHVMSTQSPDPIARMKQMMARHKEAALAVQEAARKAVESAAAQNKKGKP